MKQYKDVKDERKRTAGQQARALAIAEFAPALGNSDLQGASAAQAASVGSDSGDEGCDEEDDVHGSSGAAQAGRGRGTPVPSSSEVVAPGVQARVSQSAAKRAILSGQTPPLAACPQDTVVDLSGGTPGGSGHEQRLREAHLRAEGRKKAKRARSSTPTSGAYSGMQSPSAGLTDAEEYAI